MNMDLIYGDEIGLASVVLRLFLATLFGYIVGINREKKRRGAGTRTHALVCMSACLVMITSEYIALTFPNYSGDVARLGAQVISGMGFIGAGTIIITRYNHVRGRTTAASLWATACLGLTLGAGFISAGIVATLLMIFLLITVEKLDKTIKKNSVVHDYFIVFDGMEGFSRFLTELKGSGIKINNIEINRNKSDDETVVIITLETKMNLAEYMLELECRDSIKIMNEL